MANLEDFVVVGQPRLGQYNFYHPSQQYKGDMENLPIVTLQGFLVDAWDVLFAYTHWSDSI